MMTRRSSKKLFLVRPTKKSFLLLLLVMHQRISMMTRRSKKLFLVGLTLKSGPWLKSPPTVILMLWSIGLSPLREIGRQNSVSANVGLKARNPSS